MRGIAFAMVQMEQFTVSVTFAEQPLTIAKNFQDVNVSFFSQFAQATQTAFAVLIFGAKTIRNVSDGSQRVIAGGGNYDGTQDY